MFGTLFKMSGVKVDGTQLDMIVDDVMQTLDDDGNGVIDLEEFIEGSLKKPFIFDMLCQ
jgi:Ca2+-binding EF-hand superfamily protein